MPMVWNDQADAKLLVAIIATNNAKLNWSAIAEYMGAECSISAVQHRITRLKERVKAENPELVGCGSVSGSASPDKSNNKKKGRAKAGETSENATETTTAVITASPKKRGRPKKNVAHVTPGLDGQDAEMMKGTLGGDVDIEMGSPGKKIKGGAALMKKGMGKEDGEGDMVYDEDDG